MKTVEVKSVTIPYILLVLKSEDAQGNPVVREYKLVYDYNALARAEESLHIDLKSFDCWKQVTSAMTPKLVHAGLCKYHPDVPLEEIVENLNPSAQLALHEALFE